MTKVQHSPNSPYAEAKKIRNHKVSELDRKI